MSACVVRRGKLRCETAHASTNDRGEYRLTRLAPDAYLVVADFLPARAEYPTVVAGRREAYVLTFYPQSADPASAEKVEARAGAEVAGIDMRLVKVPITEVRGRVVGPDGEGVKDCNLTVDGGAFSLGTRVGATTGADGRFALGNLPPRAWRIVANTSDSGASATVTVNGQDVEGVLIRLPAKVPVTGQVVLEGGAVEWEEQRLWLAPVEPSISREAEVSRDGSFRVEAPPGRYRVRGDAPPGAYLASVRAGATESRVLEVDLTSGAAASLKVVYRMDGGTVRCAVEAGETVRAINVVLLPAEEALRRPGLVRVEGLGTGTEMEFAAVRPGEYLVAAVEDGDFALLSEGEIPQAALDAAVKLKVDARGSHHVVLKPVKGR